MKSADSKANAFFAWPFQRMTLPEIEVESMKSADSKADAFSLRFARQIKIRQNKPNYASILGLFLLILA
ncbi:hypothetical protein BHF69_11785 [Anaerostipes sp. 992a]|nr:hypothetical protein BHF69_11785 [Anaerostipes sp. 992a]